MKIGKDKTTAVDPLMPADNTEYHFGVVPADHIEPDDDDDGVYLRESRAMVYFPENAIEVELKAKVWKDGKIVDVSKKLEMNDVREAIRKAEEGYIDDDDRFVLTEEGYALLKEMLQE